MCWPRVWVWVSAVWPGYTIHLVLTALYTWRCCTLVTQGRKNCDLHVWCRGATPWSLGSAPLIHYIYIRHARGACNLDNVTYSFIRSCWLFSHVVKEYSTVFKAKGPLFWIYEDQKKELDSTKPWLVFLDKNILDSSFQLLIRHYFPGRSLANHLLVKITWH